MILEVTLTDPNSTVYTKSLYQHDKNVTLVINGVDLPEKYEVHFSNQKERGISVACEGNESGVRIPDELLSTGLYVYAWVCDIGEDMGHCVSYDVVIPVIPRALPVHTSSAGGGKIDYHVDEEDENLVIDGITDKLFKLNTEEET